ncbi:UPF0061-domain-containing protein [Fomitiporia mediterranea MF3/22]|uniref:UPF0061-domain-containing protein n=1 Tax=Fomitiporia mediterranea (strain MF3/22) TaxID=694068 RepID=UPI0004408CFF|nr:UPF0061-domain-containing protein [Fomitiporia mediterranea MF3/22]EJD06907.1 UPF0061-domain-containing protein [Fomitiporia mediterranea MF3/22]
MPVTVASTAKLPISALPLPPKSHILTHNLTPDPRTGHSAREFRDVLINSPSVQRRARLVDPSAHFSRVTPMNLPFPYRIQAPENETIEDQEEFVERWLSVHEPLDERSTAAAAQSIEAKSNLKKYSRDKREVKRELIALSDSCLRDCVPQLDVGDAFIQLSTPSLSAGEEDGDSGSQVSVEQKAVREELVDILTGHSVLMSTDENSEVPYTPWSLRYSGHQFGNWAGQLGDGRAISILEVPNPSDPEKIYELQLKGAGRTPYSRSADGLAVLRSSIREYLCSEAMHALRIPTTRAFALIHLEDLPVMRETVETACVLTRVAPSFLRVGSFEALNPPRNVFFLGGGQQPANFDALSILGEWVVRRVLRLGLEERAPWGKALLMETARRNAKMVAAWQAYGFMHGVINTDNVSIMGLTIDYGPYAFMDIFSAGHICNHSDEEGRYAYKYQPTMILYALRALLNALSPLIGAEAELGTAVKAGWADGVSQEKIDEWAKTGLELEGEMVAETQAVMEIEHWALFRKRLGLRTEDSSDPDALIRPLLTLLERHKLDFHSTFRRLCAFRPALLASDRPDELKAFIASVAANSHETNADDVEFTRDWCEWLAKYAERVEGEVDKGVWASSLPNGGTNGDANANGTVNRDGKNVKDVWKIREEEMRLTNPRFVLRQWVLEEVIKRVQDDVSSGKRALAKVHQMATHPFDPWGAEGEDESKSTSSLSAEEKEERRFCGLGAKKFVGFQCSCSS